MAGRIRLSLTDEDASHVEDALAYYLAAARDNYGAGYEKGSEYDAVEKRQYERVDRVMFRLSGILGRREQ